MTIKNDEIVEFNKMVSQKVKEIRQIKGYSTLDVANILGHSSLSYVNRMERSENGKSFSLAHLYILAREFEVEVCDFLPKITKN